jgi:hypothetical protein
MLNNFFHTVDHPVHLFFGGGGGPFQHFLIFQRFLYLLFSTSHVVQPNTKKESKAFKNIVKMIKK